MERPAGTGAVLPVVAKRSTTGRERRGRGMRGPLALPGPLNPRGSAARPTKREDFDELVLSLVDRLSARWRQELGDVEFGTEDIPQLPDDWGEEPVPFGSLNRGRSGEPARIVVFRRPIELRAKTRYEQTALANEVLVEHIADLLGRDPAEIDP